MKPKINYHERLCTLCDENDIEDEYHILMKCNYFVNLREKYISRKYYNRPSNASMYKFQKLMNTTKRELFRLMLFMKCIFKEYNSRLIEVYYFNTLFHFHFCSYKSHNWVDMRSKNCFYLYIYIIMALFRVLLSTLYQPLPVK